MARKPHPPTIPALKRRVTRARKAYAEALKSGFMGDIQDRRDDLDAAEEWLAHYQQEASNAPTRIPARNEFVAQLDAAIGRIVEIEAEFEQSEQPISNELDAEYFSLLNERDRLEHNIRCLDLADFHTKHGNADGVQYAIGKLKLPAPEDRPTDCPACAAEGPAYPILKRTFVLSNGLRLAFSAHQDGTFVAGGFFPGWPLDDCIRHFQTVWSHIGLKWQEKPLDHQVHIDGCAIGFPTDLDDAISHFLTLTRLLPGQAIAVHKIGCDTPILVSAVATADETNQ